MWGKCGKDTNYDMFELKNRYQIMVYVVYRFMMYSSNYCFLNDVPIKLCHGMNQMYQQKLWLIGNKKSIGSSQDDITIKNYNLQ